MANEAMYIPTGLIIAGNLTVGGTMPTTDRSSITQDALAAYMIPWTAWRKWDAIDTNLPGTSATDDLGLYGNTFGTGSPAIETYDVKGVGATSLYARAQFQMPPEYDAAQTVQIRAHAGMVTTVADTTATIDFEVYESDNEAGIGSDICPTAATTINSLTLADKDFTVTATGLVPGDWLDIRMTLAINDGATGTTVKGRVGYCAVLMDIRG